MLNYFFSLISQMATHTVLSHARCSTISSVSARIWQHNLLYRMLDDQLYLRAQLVSGNTPCFFICSMLNYFFSLSSYLAIHTVFSSHSRCSTISSVSARIRQHTRFYRMLDAQPYLQSQLVSDNIPCFFTCSMLNYVFSLSSYLATYTVFFTCLMLNYFFSLSSYLATYTVFFTFSMLNYFFSLSSYLATHTVFSHARCSTISSVSARI